jgi:phosphate transport system substrate-binding protein
MNRRQACLALAATTLACRPAPPASRRTLLVSGASAMVPLVHAMAQAFTGGRPELAMLVERGGSLPAYIAASRGAIDIAAMTRALSDNEDDAGARQFLIARDALGIIVHPALPVPALTSAQVRAAFAGAIGNWRALGGPDLPVTVYAHERATMARRVAEQVLQDGGDFAVTARECASDAALLVSVAADPGAIAYIGGRTRRAAGQVAVLAIDGVHATSPAVLSGRYPYTHSLYLLLHGMLDAASDDFVRFARSRAGQAIVASHGLVSVC